MNLDELKIKVENLRCEMLNDDDVNNYLYYLICKINNNLDKIIGD